MLRKFNPPMALLIKKNVEFVLTRAVFVPLFLLIAQNALRNTLLSVSILISGTLRLVRIKKFCKCHKYFASFQTLENFFLSLLLFYSFKNFLLLEFHNTICIFLFIFKFEIWNFCTRALCIQLHVFNTIWYLLQTLFISIIKSYSISNTYCMRD